MEARQCRSTVTNGLGLFICALLSGCGLAYDAGQYLSKAKQSEIETVCQRHLLRVGITAEPFRPLLFPAIFTEQGSRVTGLNIDLIRELTNALTQECRGEEVAPTLHRVRLRDLFMSLNEGKVDLFVSAVGANVPAPNMAGVAYSIPYLSNGGIAGIAKRPEVIDRVRDSLHALGEGLHAREQALAGLTIAVQEGTAAHAYAMAELKASRMIVVDSLPAAFESDDPKVDVILGSYPVLKFVTARTRKDWQLIMLEPGKPFILTKEHYAIVMPEQSYKLRWLVNKLLLRLEETGRLQDLHRRWFDENYAYPSRALSEGLPFLTGHVVQAHDPARPVDHVAPRGKAEPRTN